MIRYIRLFLKIAIVGLLSAIGLFLLVLHIMSEMNLESKVVSPQYLKKIAVDLPEKSHFINNEQISFLEKIYVENQQNTSNGTIYLVEKKGYLIRNEAKKLFKLQSTCSWYKNDKNFGCETYEVLIPRNYFMKNSEYTLFVSQDIEGKKISLTLSKQCCDNRIMAIANKRRWLEVK